MAVGAQLVASAPGSSVDMPKIILAILQRAACK